LRAFMEGRGDDLPEPLPFRELVAQARFGVSREEHERYFAELLGEVTETTAPYGLMDVHGDGATSVQARLPLDEGLAGRLREAARAHGVSPATVFHLAWARVLAVVSGRDDVVFGTILLGRMNAGAGADRVLGPFINTLPIRVRTAATSVAEALTGLRRQLADLLVHEHAPLSLAQAASGVPGGSPLFTSIFNYRHMETAVRTREGVEGIWTVFSRERTNYPLDVAVDDDGSGFGLVVEAVAPVDPERVCGLLRESVVNVVAALESSDETSLAAVDVLGAEERHRVLGEWQGVASGASGVMVPGLFEAQVVRTPDAVAVVCGEQELTYRELDERASRVAGYLGALGVGRECVVGLCLPRGVDMVAAMVGVWRAGAAYVPLDPELPA
ncbi:AMP-binding protein, partial [Streptomyces sp. NPDC001002]